jgi:hypothetical protein
LMSGLPGALCASDGADAVKAMPIKMDKRIFILPQERRE